MKKEKKITEIPWQLLLGDSVHCRPVRKRGRKWVELNIEREAHEGGEVILYCPEMGENLICQKRKHLDKPNCLYPKTRIERKLFK